MWNLTTRSGSSSRFQNTHLVHEPGWQRAGWGQVTAQPCHSTVTPRRAESEGHGKCSSSSEQGHGGRRRPRPAGWCWAQGVTITEDWGVCPRPGTIRGAYLGPVKHRATIPIWTGELGEVKERGSQLRTLARRHQ